MDRIEALARKIDPEAFCELPELPEYPGIQQPLKYVDYLFRPHRYRQALAALENQGDEWARILRERAAMRDRQAKAREAARIAIGLEIVLAGRLTQKDDGK